MINSTPSTNSSSSEEKDNTTSSSTTTISSSTMTNTSAVSAPMGLNLGARPVNLPPLVGGGSNGTGLDAVSVAKVFTDMLGESCVF